MEILTEKIERQIQKGTKDKDRNTEKQRQVQKCWTEIGRTMGQEVEQGVCTIKLFTAVIYGFS